MNFFFKWTLWKSHNLKITVCHLNKRSTHLWRQTIRFKIIYRFLNLNRKHSLHQGDMENMYNNNNELNEMTQEDLEIFFLENLLNLDSQEFKCKMCFALEPLLLVSLFISMYSWRLCGWVFICPMWLYLNLNKILQGTKMIY